MTSLRDHLLDAYGGFADRRHKDRDLDRPVMVDDRDATDVYPYFCSIFASMPDRNSRPEGKKPPRSTLAISWPSLAPFSNSQNVRQRLADASETVRTDPGK